MPSIPFRDLKPKYNQTVFIAPDAWIIGDVVLEDDVSVYFGCVLRGDIEPVRIGRGTNLQEHCTCHTSHGSPCTVGSDVTVGHEVTLHGCEVKDRCIIGMGSVILDNAIIEPGCIIGANLLVTKGTVIPSGSLALGSPAKVVRWLKADEQEEILRSSAAYLELCGYYRGAFQGDCRGPDACSR